jgi:hypothetical protein
MVKLFKYFVVMSFVWLILSYIIGILVDAWIPSEIFDSSLIHSSPELASEIALNNRQSWRQRARVQFLISLVMACSFWLLLKRKNLTKRKFFFVRCIMVSSIVSLASSSGFLFADLFL